VEKMVIPVWCSKSFKINASNLCTLPAENNARFGFQYNIFCGHLFIERINGDFL
jgi:hypothetical protein